MTKQLPHRLRSLLGSLTGSQRDPRSSAVSRRGTVLALALGVMLVSPGCKGDRTKADSWQDNAGEPASSSSEPSTSDTSSSSSVGSLGMMSSLLSGQVSQPGPYEEPDASEGFDSDAPHTAVVELSGAVTELKGFSWTGGFEGTEMRPLLDRLHELAAEENVSGLLLRFGDLSIGPAIAEELTTELHQLRTTHPSKRITCHAEAVSTYTYWVMSACSEIALAPGGEVSIPGVAAVPMHLKGLLDKVGVRADFLHIGDYKGAAEPLTLDAPSKQSRETTAMILDQAFNGFVDAVSKGRALEPDAVRALVDKAMIKAIDAKNAKLIDAVATFSEFRAKAGEAWRIAKVDEGDPTQKLFEMIGLRPVTRPSGDRVALVYAVGNVVDGGGNVGGAREEIASRTLVAALDAIGRDDEVKAVVIRVVSPGGSALASEVIWNAVSNLKKTRPVIISMGGVAASGGYYIAAPATHIFALNNTLTGSIGVVGGKLATAGGLAKLGVKTFPTGRGKHSLLFASPEPWSAEDRAIVKASMQAVYDQFSGRVREGRGDIDDSLMQGRVWTGAKALEHKLVDQIGTLRHALAFAHLKTGLAATTQVEVYPPDLTLRDMFGSLGVSSGSIALRLVEELGLPADFTRALRQTVTSVQAFERHPVQAVLIKPLLFR